MRTELSIGARESETSSDAAIVTDATKASCLKRSPTIPLTKASGMKTATVVRVEEEIAEVISPAPKIAASAGREPSSICRVMFSNTTTVLSTTIPSVIESAISEKMFIVYPKTYMKIRPMMSEKGIVSVMMRLPLHSLRKTRMTKMTKIAA